LFTGGSAVVDLNKEIVDTQDDALYLTARTGVFQYNVPVPNGNYEVALHFAELSAGSLGGRVFFAKAEGQDLFGDIDVFRFAGSTLNRAVTMEKAVSVADGVMSLWLEEATPKRGDPKLCGIEIKSLGPHLAHAVTGGPYTVVDTKGAGSAVVNVDGSGSHTHGPGLVLAEYVWRSGSTVLGRGEKASLTLPVGVSALTLTIRDSGGNTHTETTQITVLSSEFPDISGLSPLSGPMAGGTFVTIKGTGFKSLSSGNTTVLFGETRLTGSAIQVINATTITFVTPASSVATPVAVSVLTPVGESNKATFTYVANGGPISFTSGLMARIRFPTAMAFGPDRRLYVGTYSGQINRIEFKDGTLKIASWITKSVTPNRPILGIAFDPVDTGAYSTPYISHSFFFHGSATSSSGESINGKISKVIGSAMDRVEDVIINLPVSDHDHGLNNIQFGDNRELYITVGGNTNAGLPGALSSSQTQKENVLSAAILVAYVNRPDFDGVLKYDALDDGNLIGGNGVELYSVGLRNPFGLIQHSNGNLYTNDNGPNVGFGDVVLGCNGERMADVGDYDKLIRLEKGAYYGHPNPKRAQNDTRQCVWRASTEPSGNGYTAPMMRLESATGSLIEFMTDHFGGQLRGNLIYSQYKGALHRVILSADGKDVLPASNPALPLVGGTGLAVTQAPSGELLEARYHDGHVYFHRPVEAATNATIVTGVFPYRGARPGGSTLHIYGSNLNHTGTPTVRVGGAACPVTVVRSFRVACTLPSGSGTADVQLTVGASTVTFPKSYRYIAG
jgi:glucose/arabinose dehydrogenase